MPIRQIDNTVKIYTKVLMTLDWNLEPSLTCLNITDGYGLVQEHTAQLKVITPDMKNASAVPAEQAAIEDAKKAMRYNADEEFQITKPSTFYGGLGIQGLWVKVTNVQDIEEVPTEVTLFIGQIFGNNFDWKTLLNTSITAYGLDVLLSHQGLVGSWCNDVSVTPDQIQFDSVMPYFNPQNRPNMGEIVGDVNPFDYAMYFDENNDDRYWKPSSVVVYILHRLNNQEVEKEPAAKRYTYFSALTDTQLFLEIEEFSDNPFTNQQRVSDLFVNSDSIWATLVQLVEINGSFSLTIKYSGDNAIITAFGT